MTSLHDPASSIDRLPADQQAVMQMVLARGQSYDEIAGMLSIDRAAVRQRALAALDALGPTTRVSPERRALVTDYLLGQLPERVSEEVRARLAHSAGERAWARVVASELAALSGAPLPEIPAAALSEEAAAHPAPPSASPEAPAPRRGGEDGGPVEAPRRVSRRGGAILLAAVAAAAIAAIVIFVVIGVGGSGGSHVAASGSGHPAPPKTTGTASAKSSGTAKSSGAKVLAQINLSSPTHAKALGVAQVIQAGSTKAMVIRAGGLQPNTRHDAYAVWLYNSAKSALRLGYVKPGVGSNGVLETVGGLPKSAGTYKRLIVTLQDGPSSKPGKIVLQGTLSGL
jgi:hypothetical protein